MSVRTKILLLLALGILVSVTVALVAFASAAKLDQELEQVLGPDLDSLRTASKARDALRDARTAEETMVSLRDAAMQTSVDRSIEVVRSSLGPTPEHATDAETFAQVMTGLAEYHQVVAEMAGEIRAANATLSTRTSELRLSLKPLRNDLEQIVRRLGLTPRPKKPRRRKTPGSPEGDPRDKLAGRIDRLRTSLSDLGDFQPQAADLAEGGGRRAREDLRRRLRALADEVGRVTREALSAGIPVGTIASLGGSSQAVGDAGKNVLAAVEEANRRMESVVTRAQSVRGRLQAKLFDLSTRAFRLLEERRSQIEAGYTSGVETAAGLMTGGLLLLILLGGWLTRDFGDRFTRLLASAQKLGQGELDAKVSVGGRDELGELAEAMRTMARDAHERRQLQSDYSGIVARLNSMLVLDDILTGSLELIVGHSGSDVGAIYLVDESGDRLACARSFGLSRERMAEHTYRLGEGLVGQAALDQRTLHVRPAVDGGDGEPFEIDTGIGRIRAKALLLVPLVRLDHLQGVFVLASSSEYDDDAVNFIEESVFQVAVAINNARAVETIQQTAEKLKRTTGELVGKQAHLEKINRELEQANRLKSDFLANMTHELRTPLNSILGFTELVLERDQGLTDTSLRQLGIVMRNASSLLKQINDLLDITKIETGRVEITLGQLDLRTLVDECLDTVRPMLASESIALVADVEPGAFLLWTDHGKLRQVVTNLLGNAAKFTEQGSIRVSAHLSEWDLVEVSVTDTGIGIAPEQLPKVFDKFHQVDPSASRKYGGTGLGLAIASELIRLLGGTLKVKSRLGGGSTFTFVLPLDLRQVDLEGPREGSRATADGEPDGALAGLLGLGAPDEPEVRERSEDRPVAPTSAEMTIVPGLAREESVVVALEARPEELVTVREGLRREGFRVKSAFNFSDAERLLNELKPVALVLGEALPEDRPEAGHRGVRRALREHHIPVLLVAEAEPGLLEGIEPRARIDQVTGESVAELLALSGLLEQSGRFEAGTG